jgi:hypothetical protein
MVKLLKVFPEHLASGTAGQAVAGFAPSCRFNAMMYVPVNPILALEQSTCSWDWYQVAEYK